MPKNFDGKASELTNWQFSVVQHLEAQGESDEVRKQQFASQLLEKQALTWWRQQCFSTPGLHTTMPLAEFFAALENQFKDVQHIPRVRAQFKAMQQGKDTVRHYSSRFRAILIEMANHVPDDETILDQYVQGLNPSIRYDLTKQYPATLQEAEERAVSCETADRIFRIGQPRQQQKQVQRQHVPLANPGYAPMQVDAIYQQPQRSDVRKNRGKGKQQQSRHPPRVDQPVQRPHNQPKFDVPLSQIQCYKCKQFGHYANNCRNGKAQASTAAASSAAPPPPPRPHFH